MNVLQDLLELLILLSTFYLYQELLKDDKEVMNVLQDLLELLILLSTFYLCLLKDEEEFLNVLQHLLEFFILLSTFYPWQELLKLLKDDKDLGMSFRTS